MYYELSKKEKKIARQCIEKGLDTASKEGLQKCEAVINEWRQGKFSSNKERIINYTKNFLIRMMPLGAGMMDWADQDT
jgi:hypothetical protein